MALEYEEISESTKEVKSETEEAKSNADEKKNSSMRARKEQIKVQIKASKRDRVRYNSISIFGMLLAICVNVYGFKNYFTEVMTKHEIVIVVSVLIVLYAYWLYRMHLHNILFRVRVIELNSELSEVENLLFLDDIEGLNQEEKALKQLARIEENLEKYHILNFTHMKSIFRIGVGIVIFGLALIVATGIYALIQPNTQTLTIISGLVGGVLVDGVGAIFIHMYSKTIESTDKDYASIVKTAHTYYGIVLASQIEDKTVRENTLAGMAKALASAKESDAK